MCAVQESFGSYTYKAVVPEADLCTGSYQVVMLFLASERGRTGSPHLPEAFLLFLLELLLLGALLLVFLGALLALLLLGLALGFFLLLVGRALCNPLLLQLLLRAQQVDARKLLQALYDKSCKMLFCKSGMELKALCIPRHTRDNRKTRPTLHNSLSGTSQRLNPS